MSATSHLYVAKLWLAFVFILNYGDRNFCFLSPTLVCSQQLLAARCKKYIGGNHLIREEVGISAFAKESRMMVN